MPTCHYHSLVMLLRSILVDFFYIIKNVLDKQEKILLKIHEKTTQGLLASGNVIMHVIPLYFDVVKGYHWISCNIEGYLDIGLCLDVNLEFLFGIDGVRVCWRMDMEPLSLTFLRASKAENAIICWDAIISRIFHRAPYENVRVPAKKENS